MRLVVQRVTQASVTVEDEVVGQIGPGLVILVGLDRDDCTIDFQLVKKVLKLRLFPDTVGGRWRKSVSDAPDQLNVLLVSQFTLYGEPSGRRIDFHKAMPPQAAARAYSDLIEFIRAEYPRAQDGRFGAMMKVALVNDGPVTLVLDSRKVVYTHNLPPEIRQEIESNYLQIDAMRAKGSRWDDDPGSE